MHSAAGRTYPGSEENKLPHVDSSPYVPEAPSYLPQPGDDLIQDSDQFMGPIGPHATGITDWGPLSGLTGTRRVVDQYSITRFSEAEWRRRNKEIIDRASKECHKYDVIDWNARQSIDKTQKDAANSEESNTNLLNQREADIHRWKCELKAAIGEMNEEIQFLETERQRLKRSMIVLLLPESISRECLERRTGRRDAELVRDEVEVELMKEMSLSAAIRELLVKTLKKIETQLQDNKTAKARLEYDWSDKILSHEIETVNKALSSQSRTIMFKPGSVVCPGDQSNVEYWNYFSEETIKQAAATRERSAALRGTSDAILENASRDLRSQANRVEVALSKRIACTQEATNRLELELKNTLIRLAEVERTADAIELALRRLDFPMKTVQTRLDNRAGRPRIENCRDEVHFPLLQEVKSLGEHVSVLKARLQQTIDSKAGLEDIRNELEREIRLKKHTLDIDRNRVSEIRTHYPSTTSLSGY